MLHFACVFGGGAECFERLDSVSTFVGECCDRILESFDGDYVFVVFYFSGTIEDYELRGMSASKKQKKKMRVEVEYGFPEQEWKSWNESEACKMLLAALKSVFAKIAPSLKQATDDKVKKVLSMLDSIEFDSSKQHGV